MTDWRALRVWGMIALVAAAVAAAHMAFVVSWAAGRDRTIWTRVDVVDARLSAVEDARLKARLERLEEAFFGEGGAVE